MLSVKDRKILLLFLKFFFISFVFLIVLFAFLNYITILAKYSPDLKRLPIYYLYFSGMIIYWIFPINCLMAAFLTLSYLNRNNEVLAFLSLGYSLKQVALPILTAIASLCILMLSFNLNLLPYMVKKRKQIFYEEFKKKPHLYSLLKMNKVWYRYERTFLSIEIFEPKLKRAQKISLYIFNKDWSLKSILQAESARIEAPYWYLQNGTSITYEKQTPVVKNFLEQSFLLNEEASQIKNIENLTFALTGSELRQFIKKNRHSGISIAGYEVDYYNRFAHTIGALLMSLFAFLFFQVGERQNKEVMNFAGCAIITFSFWLLSNMSMNLGRHQALNPFLSVWLPPLLLSFLMMFLFNHQTKGRLWHRVCIFFKLLAGSGK